MKPFRLVALALSAALLASCGLRGGLERPPPLFGEDRARFEADLRAKAEAAEKAKAEAEAREKARQAAPAAPQTSPTSPPQPKQ